MTAQKSARDNGRNESDSRAQPRSSALRLLSALLVNRVICLTSLGRPVEALPAIHQVQALPADASGRGTMSTHFESMAIAALRAQQPALGAELVGRARVHATKPRHCSAC